LKRDYRNSRKKSSDFFGGGKRNKQTGYWDRKYKEMKSEYDQRILVTKLGEIYFNEKSLIRIPNGLLGFEKYKEFVVWEVEEFRPFKWFIAAEEPDFMLLVVEPLLFFPDYAPNISKTDLKDLKILESDVTKIYSLITLAEMPEEITINLSGPIYVNSSTNVGKQIALTGDTYSTKHNLFKSELKFFKEDVTC
jgi:flagellar assembly factor FliW